EFLDNYWNEVFEALKKSGIGEDLWGMISVQLDEEQHAEIDRIKELASRLLEGVDWDKLAHGESVFAERMNAPIPVGRSYTMMPDMVWLVRDSSGSASKNYDGLVAILQTIATEANKAAESELLSVDTTPRQGIKVANLNALQAIPQAPPLGLAVALHGDVIVITLGDDMLEDVLDLLQGKDAKKSIADDPRFKQAFAKLPAAEDEMTFFDVQGLLKPFETLAKVVLDEIESTSGDNITNAWFNEEANKLSSKGVKAYQQHDYQQALEFTKQAYEVAPTDSRVMYNLACFHALVGNEEDALTWLEKAVAGGFNAPKQISQDSDLKELHGQPRYEAALASAANNVTGDSKRTVEQWKYLSDRILDAVGMVDYTAAVTYTDGYSVHTEEITVLVPDAAGKPFYQVIGTRKPLQSFDRYLPKETVSYSVDAGLSLDELYAFVEDTIRGAGKQGEELLAKWAGLQQMIGVDLRKDVLGWIHGETISISMKQPGSEAGVFMLKVNDEAVAREKITTALDFLSTTLQQRAQSNPMLAMLALQRSPCTHEKLAGFHNIGMGMMPQPMVWGVTDGYLIMGTSADAVALCLATAAGEHPGIRENAQVMAEAVIPQGAFRSASFADKRNLGAEIAQVIGMVSAFGGMAAMNIPDPEAQKVITKVLGMGSKLIPVAQKIDFYKSCSGYTTFDGNVWYKKSVTNYRTPVERVATTTE
ncbi:MAG: hypothetical protein KJ749_00095, partial [Planctomycetes bacterium]|nr:hypothetical protein [Planctomycetota bacterium]